MKNAARPLFPLLALAATLALPVGLLGQDSKPASEGKAPAEGRKRPEGSGSDRSEAMRQQRDAWMKDMGLTEEQMGKLRDITKSQGDKMRELRANTALSDEDRRKKSAELRDSTNGQIKKVLSADQYAKYQKLMEERRQQMGNRSGRPGGSGGEGRRPRGEGKPDSTPAAPQK